MESLIAKIIFVFFVRKDDFLIRVNVIVTKQINTDVRLINNRYLTLYRNKVIFSFLTSIISVTMIAIYSLKKQLIKRKNIDEINIDTVPETNKQYISVTQGCL